MLVRTREALSALFWSASLEPTSEFTPEDPIAFDYLNRMVGNWLFPGFTTRTSRANYYVMVLYGLGAVEEQLTSRMEPMTDANVEELFERFERFWAMSLAVHYKGVIPNDESIRGLRGVQRTFRTGVDDAYPLDYRLISRQTELGALGAYLTSLRHHHLVEDGGFRATSLGRELGRQFFATLQENKFAGQYDAFVSWALDLDNKVAPAKLGSADDREGRRTGPARSDPGTRRAPGGAVPGPLRGVPRREHPRTASHRHRRLVRRRRHRSSGSRRASSRASTRPPSR